MVRSISTEVASKAADAAISKVMQGQIMVAISNSLADHKQSISYVLESLCDPSNPYMAQACHHIMAQVRALNQLMPL